MDMGARAPTKSRPIWRRTLAVIAAAVVASSVLPLPAAAAPAEAGASLPAGDRMVSLPDHRKLNFRCQGQGAPTVLLETGFGADASAWWRVLPKIAAQTRVCAYDRAGYGYSDPGPLPRDGAAIARDLDNGLKAARIPGPYIVVAHSAGGLYARLFAARRPKQVVGLVFVDSSVEHQTQRMQALFGPNAGTLDSIQRRVQHCLAVTSAPRTSGEDPALLECAPIKGDAHARQVQLRPETWRIQLSELDNLFTTTSDEVDRTDDILKDIPAIVLTASTKSDGVAAGPDDPGAEAWQQFHRQLADRFLEGEQRLVKSSHLMMIDRPEVVAGAALDLVAAARKH
jgi:pimeloyl-ACP methyl ester carboxylesterase